MMGASAQLSTPSSSRSSRTSASASTSPWPTFPPGNSHQPAMCLPAGRSAMRTRPRESNNAAATTRRRGLTDKLFDSFEHAVAVLELLAAAAGTRRIAPHLGRGTHGTLQLLRWRSATRARRRRLRRRVAAGTGELRQRGGLGMLRLQRQIEAVAALFFLALDLLGRLHFDVDRREDGDGLELDALEHGGEQLEGFALVFE